MLDRRAVIAGGISLLAAPALARARSEDIVLTAPDGRKVTARVAGPRRSGKALLLLSHGANGTFEGLGPLMRALTRERTVVAPLHVDSEAHPQHRELAPAEVWRTRVEDMRLLLDRFGRRPVVAVGHSYGALVAQALGGATVFGRSARDLRVSAVVAISPPGALPNFVGPEDWARIAVPMLVTTGTADVVPMIAPTWQAHLGSFEASKAAGTAAWVGRGVDHYFGRNIQRLTRDARDQSAQFAALLAIVNRYIAATVERDSRARRWLAADGPAKTFPNETDSWTWR